MAKRRTREEMREEFVRLARVRSFVHQWQMEADRANSGEASLSMYEKSPRDFDTLLADFDAQRRWTDTEHPHRPDEPKWTASMHLEGLREAVNDYLTGIIECMADPYSKEDKEFARLPETYFEQTGRDLFADGGNPMGRAKAILKSDKIASEEEWRLLNELVSNVDSSLLTPKQRQKAEKLMGDYQPDTPHA
jgi:hypothetical protein